MYHHLHREHRRRSVGSGKVACADVANIDAARAEKSGQIEHHAGLIQTHHIDTVGDHIRSVAARLGAPDVDIDACRFAELLELVFQLGKRVPVA